MLTIAQFLFRSVAKKRRNRAGVKIAKWAGKIVRGWARDLDYLDRVKEVGGIVLPAGMEEQVLDVLTYFERRYMARRANVVEGEDGGLVTYMAEDLSDVVLLRIPKGVREAEATRARLIAQSRTVTEFHGLARWCFHPVIRRNSLGSSPPPAALYGMWQMMKGVDEQQRSSLRVLKRRGCREASNLCERG